MKKLILPWLFIFISISCSTPAYPGDGIKTGASRTSVYIPLLKNKRIGIVANQTSLIGNSHLVDSLVSLNIDLRLIFTPEHGFRGKADAGAFVESEVDVRTGIEVVSLYGNHKKPSTESLSQLDLVIFDLQDAGTRFYTYISTLHLVMEACAENGIPLIVLDRPNPNAHYVDGPVLETEYRSFVGMHPVPLVYGMTIGEYAQMITGEGWLNKGVECELTVVPCEGYDHFTEYNPPVKPSPNLPDLQAIRLYPSLCLFEGTSVSIGRGTTFPFTVYGHPSLKGKDFSFTPESLPGAMNPKWKGEKCQGYDLRNYPTDLDSMNALNLEWLISAYHELKGEEDFFHSYFEKLAGTRNLREQIIHGWSAEEIKSSWKEDLDSFRLIREKYLLYP